jgi:hypothetical protein
LFCYVFDTEDVHYPDSPNVLLHAKTLDRRPRKQSSKVPQGVDASDGTLRKMLPHHRILILPPESLPEDSDHVNAGSDNDNANGKVKDKGKGRMLPVPADVEEIDSDQDEVDDGQEGHTGNKPGRLPQEAISKAAALGDETYAKASEIAKEYGKDVSTILIAAGLSTKATRGENPWNMYQAWYRVKHPKSPDGESSVVLSNFLRIYVNPSSICG